MKVSNRILEVVPILLDACPHDLNVVLPVIESMVRGNNDAIYDFLLHENVPQDVIDRLKEELED